MREKERQEERQEDREGRGLGARARRALGRAPRLTFTREGQLVSLTALALGVAATNSGNNLLYLILGMMLALILSSGLLSSLNLTLVHARRRAPELVQAGAPFEVTLGARNLKRRWPSLGVTVEDAPWRRVGAAGGAPASGRGRVYFFALHGDAPVEGRYAVTLPRRGRYRAGDARLLTRFPFGLFEKSIGVPLDAALTAHPPLLDPPPAALRAWLDAARAADEERDARDAPPPRADALSGDLLGLRPLAPGEPARAVHWRASAKRGELVRALRADEESPARPLALLTRRPTAAALSEDDEDDWAALAATACALALTRGALRVLTPDAPPWEVRDAAGLARLLAWLATARLTPSDEPWAPPREALTVCARGAEGLLEGGAPTAAPRGGEGRGAAPEGAA